jgi:hypothetical protein
VTPRIANKLLWALLACLLGTELALADVETEVTTTGAQPTAGAAGQKRRVVVTPEGEQYVVLGGPNLVSCFVEAVTATTKCGASPGAGLRFYVLSAAFSNEAATVQTLDIVYGTGSNCATGTTALTHKHQLGTNATTTSPFIVPLTYGSPLVPAAGNDVCIRPSAATAFGATLTGWIGP